MRQVNIALLGFGTVGTGVWDNLIQNEQRISEQTNCHLKITKILVLKIADIDYRDIPNGVLTEDYLDILNDDSIDIVIEVTGTSDIAIDFMKRALQAKKHVITANKYVISRWGKELFTLAKQNGKSLYYEATVGGGIPIIRVMTEGMTANRINSFYGILNGTTNFILCKMEVDGTSYKDALALAQKLGYAEADPTGDVKGLDAVNKLAILAMLAYNLDVHPNQIDTTGIDIIDISDIEVARDFGYKIKLLAVGKNGDNFIQLAVYPALIPQSAMIANVNDSFNGLFIKGNVVDDIMLYGRGAGSLPTGSAIVSDAISIALQGDNLIDFHLIERYQSAKKIESARKQAGKYFLRMSVIDRESLELQLGKTVKLIAYQTNQYSYAIIDVPNYQTLEVLINLLSDKKVTVYNTLKVEELEA